MTRGFRRLHGGTRARKGRVPDSIQTRASSVAPGGATHSAPTGALPCISVVIPVLNEAAHLGRLLDDLLAQDYPPERFEILVVDGGSSDGTAGVARDYARSSIAPIRVLTNPRRLSSAGRNVGVLCSRGELVVFIDGHCRIPSTSLLAETARIMAETDSQCLCRPQPLTGAGNTLFQDVVAHARASTIGHGRDSTIYLDERESEVNPTSSGASYRRSVFDRVGLYDEEFDACEDVELNYRVYRAGLRSYFSNRLAVHYQPRATLRALFRQSVRYGRGRVRLMKKHPDAASPSQLVPAGFVAGLAAVALAAWLPRPAAEGLGLALAAYAALVLGYSITLGARQGWRHAIAAPAVYLAIHVGFGAGFWFELGRAARQALRRARGRWLPERASEG